MSKKKAKMHKVEAAPKKQGQVIDMNEINRKKAYHPVNFKTGRYMTEKDRPRKKNWERELEDFKPTKQYSIMY